MDSRDLILQKIRSSKVPAPMEAIPDLPPLFESENPSPEKLKETFAESLTALTGNFFSAANLAEARETLEKLAKEKGWDTFSTTDTPLLRELFPEENFSEKAQSRFYFGEANGETDKTKLAEIPVSLVFPQFLIAETGTCVVLNRTAHERLNCYLNPSCVMAAYASQLREFVQDTWESVTECTSNSQIRGEYVLVTGPSRTADIERVSVLGVHGPKNIYVILIQD